MDITLYISRFLYRIRHQLIFGTLIVTALVAYFSQFMEKKYTVTTSIYTGITSNTGLDEETKPDWQAVNNTYDNLVNLTKSRGTLENVSLKLLALNLTQGNPEIDNLYITADNYKKLTASIPEEIINLIDTASLDNTINRFKEYKNSDSRNYLHELLNGGAAFYSYAALSSIIIRRQGNSDLIEIAYTSSDPGITWNTVKLVSEEMKYSYDNLKYKTANDIVKYYEQELNKLRTKLNQQENDLTALNKDTELTRYQDQLKDVEKRIALLTDKINSYKESKEGVAIDGLVQEWLSQTLIQVKSKADLEILNKRKHDFEEQYKNYSPIGTKINQQEREINVTEQSYLQVLHALNMAKMKQVNLQLTSSNLTTISEAAYPLFSDKGKRMFLVIAAFIGSLIFIIALNLVIELLDRTLRDAERAKRLTGMNILGAFNGRNSQLKYRGFVKTCNRISAAYACNRLAPYLQKNKTLYINILSIEEREGKTFVAKYFQERWEELGFQVRYIRIGEEINIESSLFTTENIEEYIKAESQPDIVLIEYPSIQGNSVPPHLLSSSQVNILIANVRRVWKNSDKEFVSYLREITKNTSLYLYLNNASREAVEDFTGQLPPQTSMRSFTNRMMYMGLTATNSAIK